MLDPANPKAKDCYARAAMARERAAHARTPEERADCLKDEERWLKLAQSYELTARLTAFLNKQSLPPHPRCATCQVPMWQVGTQHVPGHASEVNHHYECKVCDAKLVVPAKNGA